MTKRKTTSAKRKPRNKRRTKSKERLPADDESEITPKRVLAGPRLLLFKQSTRFLKYSRAYTTILILIGIIAVLYPIIGMFIFIPFLYVIFPIFFIIISSIAMFVTRSIFLRCRKEILGLLTPEEVLLISSNGEHYAVGEVLPVFDLLKTLRLLERAPRVKRILIDWKYAILIWVIIGIQIYVSYVLEEIFMFPFPLSIMPVFAFSVTFLCIGFYTLPFGGLRLKPNYMLIGYLSLIEFYTAVTTIRNKAGGIDAIINPFLKSEQYILEGLYYNTEIIVKNAILPARTQNVTSYYLTLILAQQLGNEDEKLAAKDITIELRKNLAKEKYIEFFECLTGVETQLTRLWNLQKKIGLNVSFPPRFPSRREIIGWIISAIIAFAILGLRVFFGWI